MGPIPRTLPVEVWMYDNNMMEGGKNPDLLSTHQMLDDAKKFARIMSRMYTFGASSSSGAKWCVLVIVEQRYGRRTDKPIIMGRDVTPEIKTAVKKALDFPVKEPKKTAVDTLAQSAPKLPEKPAKGK